MTLYWFSLSLAERFRISTHKALLESLRQRALYTEAFDQFLRRHDIKRNPEWEKANGRMLTEIDSYRAINIGPPPAELSLSHSKLSKNSTSHGMKIAT